MKYVKMLGLTALAAMAVAAFLGAGTASASSLCQVNESPCKAPFTGEVVAKSPEATLTAGSFVVKCASEAAGSLNASGVGTISKLTFSGCKGECTEAITTPAAVKPPYKAVGDATGGGNGKLLVTKGTAGTPGAELLHCTGFNVSCTYTTAEAVLGVTGGNPAKLVASSIALKRTGGSFLCPENGTWSATYTVTSPAGALFLVA